MALTLNIYAKGNLTKAVATGTDTDGAEITGLTAGTVVAKGDYVATHADPDGKLAESDAVDVPAFTVETKKAESPTSLSAAATSDGATITAE